MGKAEKLAAGVAIHDAIARDLEGVKNHDGEAFALVEELLEELAGRAGFDHVLDGLASAIRAELVVEWTRIVGEHMDRAAFGPAADDDDTELPF